MPMPHDSLDVETRSLAGRVALDLADEISALLAETTPAGSSATGEHARRITALLNAFQSSFAGSASAPADLAAAIERAITLCEKRLRLKQQRVSLKMQHVEKVAAGVVAERTVIALLHQAIETAAAGSELVLSTRSGGSAIFISISEILQTAGQNLAPKPVFSVAEPGANYALCVAMFSAHRAAPQAPAV